MATIKKTTAKKPLAKAQYGRAVVSTDKESNYTASGKKIGTGFGKKAEYRNFATGDGDTNYAPTKEGRAVKNEVKASNRAATKSGNIVIKKTGGATGKLPKAQFGRTVVKSKFTREGISDSKHNNDVKDVYNRKGDLVKTKINRTTTYNDGVKPLKSKITIKPGKPTVTKFPSLSRTMRIKSDPATGEAIKKMGGATKSKKK